MAAVMKLEKVRLVVFDWDGTLMDSIHHIIHAMQGAARQLGQPEFAETRIRDIIGLGLPEAVATLLPDADVSLQEDFCDAYREQYRAIPSTQQCLFAGARELLSSLREKGYLLAVATGKGRSGLNRVLQQTQMLDFFDATRCADETRSKPHPLMLQELMLELQVQPHQTLMVGDSTIDMEMAQNAGIARLAVSYGVHAAQRLGEFAPLTVAPTVDHLHQWLVGQENTYDPRGD